MLFGVWLFSKYMLVPLFLPYKNASQAQFLESQVAALLHCIWLFLHNQSSVFQSVMR
jgi:hypothetical protein